MVRLALVAAVAALTFACKSPCRQLSEKLCDCSTNSTARTACLSRASSQESAVQPDQAANDRCQALLDANQCNCHQLNTAEGKKACGLARE